MTTATESGPARELFWKKLAEVSKGKRWRIRKDEAVRDGNNTCPINAVCSVRGSSMAVANGESFGLDFDFIYDVMAAADGYTQCGRKASLRRRLRKKMLQVLGLEGVTSAK